MLVKTEEYKGFTIKLHIDEDPRNPREEYDYFSTMLCWHSQYSLGDDNPYRDPDEAWEYITESRAVVLPLYLYDHSGLSMSTSRSYPFNDPWDAGQVGWIFIEREKVLKEYSRKKLTRSLIRKAEDMMMSEVREYDDYLRGEVYGYVVNDKDGEHIDSCCGFYGDLDYVVAEAKSVVDASITQLELPFPKVA